ncbi:aquaporin NIP2-1-like [Gastrolobium bilobum]|uniref:aquaporin NIP2-1-like n=1 Tax=Gastrolobium bilobum TaxID=150636 RepID=UPI002AB0585D|nr:aquaporin NIP2-1-like [Gastrolobium bilobum]
MEGTDQKICSFINDTNDQLQNPRTHKQSHCLSFAKLAQNYPPGFPRMVFAEIIGTYLLVFLGSGASALNAIDENKVSKLAGSLAGGFTVTVMIYAIGHISGAHMNPAVSLAFAAVRRFPWKQVPFYIAAQLTGAISASYTVRALLDPAKQLGETTPSGSDIQALIMEMVSTFTLMFIATAVSTDKNAIGELGGLAVGFSVSIAGIVAGPISGGSMNPVRTLGPAIASASYKGLWVYMVGPVTGAILGAWSYTVIQGTDKPASVISLSSFPFKLRQRMNETELVRNNDHLTSV